MNGFIFYLGCCLILIFIPICVLSTFDFLLPVSSGSAASPPFKAKDSDLALLANIPLALLDSSLCWWISFCAHTTCLSPCHSPRDPQLLHMNPNFPHENQWKSSYMSAKEHTAHQQLTSSFWWISLPSKCSIITGSFHVHSVMFAELLICMPPPPILYRWSCFKDIINMGSTL